MKDGATGIVWIGPVFDRGGYGNVSRNYLQGLVKKDLPVRVINVGPKHAAELGKKTAAERYAAFLDFAPSLIARRARELQGEPLARALDAYGKARELSGIARRLSLDPAATVFQIGGILAEVADRPSLKR